MSLLPLQPPSTSSVGLPPGHFPPELAARIAAERIVAVITVEDPADAVPLARALVEGGIRAMELAWRTAATAAALQAIVREVPEMLAGVGTILSAEQVDAVVRLGGAFGVSPGLSPTVLAAARRAGLPFAPGVQTASEIQIAIEHGCRLLKFFPAQSAGGLAHLRALHAPFAHLALRYIALGGIDEASAGAYLKEPVMAAIGGSWIAPASLVRQRAWGEIRERARAALALAAAVGNTAA